MEMVTGEVISALRVLAPGFVAAWVLFSLTVERKQSDLEKVVQALIFSFVVQGLIVFVRGGLLWLGRYQAIGHWTQDCELVWSLLLGASLGMVLAWGVNTDSLHKVLRRFGITKQTSRPSVWYSAFGDHARYVVLHLKDGRRIYGWPREWPSVPGTGHIRLENAAWLMDREKGEQDFIDLKESEFILLPASEVLHVEFVKFSVGTTPTASGPTPDMEAVS